MTVVRYRCVCGNAIGLISASPRECSHCGRAVPDRQFSSGDRTIVGDIDTEPAGVDDGDPLLNQMVKHFRIVAPLGEGGMGRVYRAVDESLQRDVALKVIHPRMAHSSAAATTGMRRLLEEARSQARVCHPNVVQVYYVEHQNNTPFLAMELVRGETLDSRLQRGLPEFSETIDIAVQTCRALKAAAEFRVMHGDIKPANLLVAEDGTIKLSDFGLARSLDQAPPGLPTISGTPNYLSPEACRGQPTDGRADMYSLGVMLFEMTFGRLPYRPQTHTAIAYMQAHAEAVPEFPERWPEHLPLEWKSLLAQLMSKDPQDRFTSYDQLLERLERLRPTRLPMAGRATRGLAWGADLLLLFSGMQLLRLTWSGSVAATLSILALLAAARLSAARNTTFGRTLFQLDLVDGHGFHLSMRRRFARNLIRQLPCYGLAGLRLLIAAGCTTLGWSVFLVLMAISLVDGLFALFRRDRKSFHDLLFHSVVVLDTRTSPSAAPRAETPRMSKSATRRTRCMTSRWCQTLMSLKSWRLRRGETGQTNENTEASVLSSKSEGTVVESQLACSET